jgi:hypothetical protein
MNVKEIAELGAAMREAQKEYFRTRSEAALAKSKELEKRFDLAVREILTQPTLF